MWELADGESQLSLTLELPLTLRGHILYVAHANVKHSGGYSLWEWDRDHNKANLILFFVFVIGEWPDSITLPDRSTAPVVTKDQYAAVDSPSFSIPYQFSSLSKPHH